MRKALALSLLLVLGVAAPAQAHPPAYRAVTFTQTSIKIVQPSTLAITGCSEQGNRYEARNFIGALLWAFELYVEWCSNGFSVLYPSAHTRGFVYMTGWSWQRTNLDTWYGATLIPQAKWKAIGEAEFKFCIPLVNCIQYNYPWLKATVNGSGSVDWQGGI